MKKAVNVGIATGIIISIIFIAGSLIRKAIPQAAFENRGVYLLVLGGLVALVFWMAMRYYSRSENHDVSLFHVKVGSLELNEFTGSMFTKSWLNETGLISYLIGGPTDLEIKCTIVQAIFKKEHIKS